MSELTDRMRTCAAYILGRKEGEPWSFDVAARDAADLLIEASNALEAAPPPLGEPMAIIKQKVDEIVAEVGTWIAPGGPLPTGPRLHSRHRCPKCDSRVNKTVRKVEGKLMLECPVCSKTWEYRP